MRKRELCRHFRFKYNSSGILIGDEINALTDIYVRLAAATTSFSSAACNVKSAGLGNTHQINELLDLVFETRKLAEKVEKVLSKRTEAALDAIESCDFFFDYAKVPIYGQPPEIIKKYSFTEKDKVKEKVEIKDKEEVKGKKEEANKEEVISKTEESKEEVVEDEEE